MITISKARLAQSFETAQSTALRISRLENGTAVYVVPEIQIVNGVPEIISFGFDRFYSAQVLARAENNTITVC